MLKFPEVLRGLRKENNLSQTQAAQAAGETQRVFSFWETGRNQPTPDDIEKLCRYFDVSADYLLGFTWERRPFPKE